jgi:two-component system CheB/CheR fusion protein
MFDDRRQHFEVHLPAQSVWLAGDPVRLTQVVANLLDNAGKYTQAGGTITLDATVVGDEIELGVRDNGHGIATDLLPHVFDLFQQGHRPLDRAQGGLGIGLTLVQQMVLMHGGRIAVESPGPDQGSSFTVHLPITAGQTGTEPRQEDEASAQTGRILVVDDDPAVAECMATLLEVMGYTVAVAGSGQAALDQAPAFRPQVVLLDIGLKGMDGFETARRLRQLPHAGEMCLVAVTGYADEGTRDRALAAGCDHHMAKPVNPDVLLAFVAERTASAGIQPAA